MSQLNDIHADIGALQAQMNSVLDHLDKISTIATTVAIHDERISNIRNDVNDHSSYIEGSKKRQWTVGGVILAGSAGITAFVNHLFTVKLP